MASVLTGHSLGYLTGLVKILFQLDILSRRGIDEGNVRTSSISAVSSSIDTVVELVNDEPQMENSILCRDVILFALPSIARYLSVREQP